MNKLVRYLAEHHHPRGEAFKFILVSDLVKESGFRLEEVFHNAMEAYKEGMVVVARSTVKGNRWGMNHMIPEDLEIIAITRGGLEWWKNRSL